MCMCASTESLAVGVPFLPPQLTISRRSRGFSPLRSVKSKVKLHTKAKCVLRPPARVRHRAPGHRRRSGASPPGTHDALNPKSTSLTLKPAWRHPSGAASRPGAGRAARIRTRRSSRWRRRRTPRHRPARSACRLAGALGAAAALGATLGCKCSQILKTPAKNKLRIHSGRSEREPGRRSGHQLRVWGPT